MGGVSTGRAISTDLCPPPTPPYYAWTPALERPGLPGPPDGEGITQVPSATATGIALNVREQCLSVRAVGRPTPLIAVGQVLTEIEDASVAGEAAEKLGFQLAVLTEDQATARAGDEVIRIGEDLGP